MRVQSMPNSVYTRNANGPAPQQPTPPEQPEHHDGFSWKAVPCGIGGAVVGVGAGLASEYATATATALISRVAAAALPRTGAFVPDALAMVLQGAIAGSVVLGAGAALATGAAVAYHAGAGAEQVDEAKVDPKARGAKSSSAHEAGADLRANLKDMGHADGFGSAIGHGFQAGAVLGGTAGAAAGKIQGALLGFAVGGVAGMPLLSVVNHPAVLLPTALIGGFMGAKIGEPLGYAAGAVVAGSVGAVAGAACHAGRKVTGH